MKAGDTVRLIGIPPDVKDDHELRTRTLFEKCLGRAFSIIALETVDGLPHQLVRLDVGRVLSKQSGSNLSTCNSKAPSSILETPTLQTPLPRP